MELLPKIVCLMLFSSNIATSLGLTEGARGMSWNMGIESPSKINGEIGGGMKIDLDNFVNNAEHAANEIKKGAGKIGTEIIDDVERGAHAYAGGIEHGIKEMESGIIGNIAKGTGELVEEVGKEAAGVIGEIGEGAEQIIEDIGEGIEKGAEGVINGTKGVIDGIGGIVGKLTPKKKNDDRSDENSKEKHHKHHKEHKKHDSHEHHNRHSKEDSREDDNSHEHHKHRKDDSKEGHDSHEHHKNHRKGGHGSHEKHHDGKRGRKWHHTGRGIDRKTGIGSRDGIKTPILDILGMTKSICRVSYAAESVIEDLGELHIWADKQMGFIEHAAFNYLVDNVVLKVVDGARKYHHKIIDFFIDTHIGLQKFVTNSIIEGYRVTKAPIRELFACY